MSSKMYLTVFKNSFSKAIKPSSVVNRFLSSQGYQFCTGESDEIYTMAEVKQNVRKQMGVQQGYHAFPENRSHLSSLLPTTQDELPNRSIKDSFDRALIPLATDFALQDKYVNFMGKVRFGRLMEDMDMFAVNIVFKHMLYPKQKENDPAPFLIATILVDEIKITEFTPKFNQNIRILGHVSSVGKSSVEVTVWLEQCNLGTWVEITRGVFLMVARNSNNTKSTFVNKLVPLDENETQIIKKAEDRAKQRKREDQTSLLKEPPNAEEQYLVHQVFINSSDLRDITLNRRVLPSEGGIWMSDTKMKNSILCQPEDRNLHNKIFGGFLMRNSLELAFITAFNHCKQRPTLRYSSGITFNHPVAVGSFLQMTAIISYTEQNLMQVTVYNEILHPFTSKLTTSNVFNYTYESNSHITPVIPSTYSEAMMFIDGRRHLTASVYK